METILVVDDESDIREVVRYALSREGFNVVEAEDGVEGLQKASETNPSVVILDITMPRMNGIDCCLKLRQISSTPIIFLSSKDDEQDRILGLTIGGDDYVSKPFSPKELVARVQAILRRQRQLADQVKNEVSQTNLSLEHDDIRINTETLTVFYKDHVVELTKTEFHILKTMLTNPKKVFGKGDLMVRAVSDAVIDSHIRGIRSKFKNHGFNPIETKHGQGFRLASCD